MDKPSNILLFGKALHAAVEKAIKEAPLVKSVRKQRTPAEDEALRMRLEMERTAKLDFGIPTPKRITNDDSTLDQGFADIEQGEFLAPQLDDQLSKMGSSLTGMSIMEEIQMDRIVGKLRPFLPGPLGACHNAPRACAAPSLKTHNEIMDDRQRELRSRQQTNDRILDQLEGK